MEPGHRVDVRIELHRRRRRAIAVSVRLGGAIVVELTAHPRALAARMAAIAAEVHRAIAAAGPGPVRLTVVPHGSPDWRAQLGALPWSRMLAGWWPGAAVDVDGRPALRAPANFTLELATRTYDLRRADYVRHANLWLTDGAGVTVERTEPLWVDEPYEVRFALLETIRRAAASAAVPDSWLAAFFADHARLDVDVVFFAAADRVAIAEPRRRISLARYGNSDEVVARCRPLAPGPCAIRAAMFYRGHLIQSVVYQSTIATRDARPAEVAASTTEDWAVRPRYDELAHLPAPGRVIVVNASDDDSHLIAIYDRDGQPVLGRTEPFALRLSDDAVRAWAARGRLALGLCAGSVDASGHHNGEAAPYNFKGDLTPATVEGRAGRIAELARTGRQMYVNLIESHVVPEGQTMAAALVELAGALAPANRLLQIARCKSEGTTVPWAMLYDLPLAVGDPSTELCGVIAQDLVQGGTLVDDAAACHAQATCPLRSAAALTTVCPFGFWGLRHELDLPMFQAEEGHVATQVVEIEAATPEVALISYRFPELASHRAALTAAVGTLVERSRRDDAIELLRTAAHPLLYFFCHGIEDPALGFALKIGGDPADQLIFTGDLQNEWRPAWGARRPLVVMNGCGTVTFDDTNPGDFLLRFRDFGAAGVVGTEIEVFMQLASAAGGLLIPALARGERLGAALLAMRRTLLRQLNPLGLVYSAYASSLTHIAQEHA